MHLTDTPSIPRPFTVIILGADLPALSLALSLTRKNIPFILLSRLPEDRFVDDDDEDDEVGEGGTGAGDMVPLHPSGIAVLDQLGMWEMLEMQAVVVSSGSCGGWFARVERRLGYPFALLSRRQLLRALLAILPAANIHWDTRAVDIRADAAGATVITAGMEMFCGDVVVDADAASSGPGRSVPRLESSSCENEGEWSCCVVGASEGKLAAAGEDGFLFGHGAVAVVEAGRCWWWALLRDAEDVEYSTLRIGGTSLGALWEDRSAGRVLEVRASGIAPSWWDRGGRKIHLTPYRLPPLALLSATLDLEAVAAFTNTLASSTDPATIFTAFESAFRPRVESVVGWAHLLTRAAVDLAWRHRFLRRWVLPRFPAWTYAEFSIRAVVLDEPKLDGAFWRERRIGGAVGRAADLGLRMRRALGLGEENVAIMREVLAACAAKASSQLRRRPKVKLGVGVLAGAAVVFMCARWRVYAGVGVVLKRALATSGRRRF